MIRWTIETKHTAVTTVRIKSISSRKLNRAHSLDPVQSVLFVRFHGQAQVVHETTKCFSEFGTAINFQLYAQENSYNVPKCYAYMEIRASDTVSLFSDWHICNRIISMPSEWTAAYATNLRSVWLLRPQCGLSGVSRGTPKISLF